MVLLSTLFVAAALQKEQATALGYRYAQILEMGPKKWEEIVLEKQGDSPLATGSGFTVYGEALAWRNDRLLKGRPFPLRQHLESFSVHAQEIGYASTRGGTIWSIFSGQCYRDMESTIYSILTHSYKGPKHVVSDVTRAIDRLGLVAKLAKAKDCVEAQRAMVSIRRDLAAIAADARKLSRRDSDATLEFCRGLVSAVVEQSKTQ